MPLGFLRIHPQRLHLGCARSHSVRALCRLRGVLTKTTLFGHDRGLTLFGHAFDGFGVARGAIGVADAVFGRVLLFPLIGYFVFLAYTALKCHRAVSFLVSNAHSEERDACFQNTPPSELEGFPFRTMTMASYVPETVNNYYLR